MAPWYKLGNAWYNGEGGYSETDPNAPAMDNAAYDGWVYGADFSQGMNEFRAPDGNKYIYNNSQHMGGPKLFSYDGRPVPPEVLAMVQAKVPDVQVGSDELMRKFLLDSDAPGNREGGSDLANIAGVLGFVGGGAALTGGSGLWSSLAEQFGVSDMLPTWMQPTASGVADTGFGAGTTPSLSANQLLENFASQNPGNMGFTGDVVSGAVADSGVPSWFGEALSGAGGAASALGGATQAPAPVQDMSKPYVGPGDAASSAAATSAIGRILNGTASADDWLKIGGTLGSGVLGAIGSSKQADSLKAMAEEYKNYGAPSRARFEASFAPGFTMENDPGYTDALNASAKGTLHALSVTGNPAGSPNAWAASLKDNFDRTAYPALKDYRAINGNAGGISTFNAAAPGTDAAAVGANSNIFNSAGKTLANLTNPSEQFSLAELMKKYQSGGNNIFAVA
jgi:hypothetical protein